MNDIITNNSMKSLSKYCEDFFEELKKALTTGDPSSVIKLTSLIANSPHTINNTIYLIKFEKVLNGIYYDSASRVKISDKLFGEDNEERNDNVLRTLEIIDKIDTFTKIEYLNNAIRVFNNGLIDREKLFRIAYAISNTLSEDLEFLKKNALKDAIVGNVNVHSLVSIGALVLGGIDGNNDPQSQHYVITQFGRNLDEYALSCTDDERQKAYKNMFKSENMFNTGVTGMSEDEIEEIMGV